MKQTLKQWLSKAHPDIYKEWIVIQKEERRKYINEYMRVKYYEPSKKKKATD